jgi:hypothetical protein
VLHRRKSIFRHKAGATAMSLNVDAGLPGGTLYQHCDANGKNDDSDIVHDIGLIFTNINYSSHYRILFAIFAGYEKTPFDHIFCAFCIHFFCMGTKLLCRFGR